MVRYTSPKKDPKIAFNHRVWDFVRQVPPGKVISYGMIASFLDPPEGTKPDTYRAFGARWVGGAMAGCPADVPWHRVVNGQGKISIGRRSPTGAQEQRKRLEQEGVEFDDRDRINLRVFQWLGPEE